MKLDLDALQAAAVDAWKKKSAIKISPYVLDNLIDRLRKAEAAKTCAWTLDDDENMIWKSGCGQMWSFIDGGPAENNMHYCHSCGGKLAAPDSTPTDSADSEGAKG